MREYVRGWGVGESGELHFVLCSFLSTFVVCRCFVVQCLFLGLFFCPFSVFVYFSFECDLRLQAVHAALAWKETK
jgi:hypothetical protein